MYDILCCPKSLEINEKKIISDDIYLDIQYPSHRNNAYEIDAVSYVSSINSFNNQTKDEDQTEDIPNLTQVIESQSVNKAENNTIHRKRAQAPVAPTQALSQLEIPNPPDQDVPAHYVNNAIADLNSNQNANSFDINGQIPSIYTTAECDIFKETASSSKLILNFFNSKYCMYNEFDPHKVLPSNITSTLKPLKDNWILF